ncbi:MAG: acetate--CoA ligase [Firmicutes bacterium]|nr:acetate--CoA ligase [Bacillota bacterium]
MNGLDFLFNPQQVAVIGASQSPQKIGYAILDNIIKSGYKGAIYPVNPRESEIGGRKCYCSIKDIDVPVELAVISIPAAKVGQVARECGQSGVKGLVVITAGFKEVGLEGHKLEQELLKICREFGMRMLGPNCVGLMNTHSPINASFANGFPNRGNISFISQSGAMLVSILDWSFEMGLGFSSFISLGNKADLNEVDFIESCADDPQTSVILCYIEDVTNGDRFVKVCSSAARKKPIVILKSGTSTAGAQAASSHTGALAGSDRAYDAAFRQCGVLRADSMNDLFDLARAFSAQPLPLQPRVAIVTNAGGPAIVTTDAVEKNGLKMARFTKETIDQLRENLPPAANIYNPVDLIGDARNDRYHFALDTVLKDNNVDSVLVLLCPAAVTEPLETAKSIVELSQRFASKPVMAVYMGGKSLETGNNYLTENGIPVFTFPEPSVRAIKGMVDYAGYKNNPAVLEPVELASIDQAAAQNVINDVLADRRVVMLGHEASSMMAAYGIPVSHSYLAETEEEAAKIAVKVGLPVALKISSPRILHKTDVGGVEIGLHSEAEVRRAFTRIMEKVRYFMPDAPIYGIEVQNMVEDGVEVIVGMSRDIQFGPLVVFGLGGIYVNLLEEVTFRLATALVTREEVEKMIAETKAYTLLKGYRGKKAADIGALTDSILRTARMVSDLKQITEMDINPIRVHTKGVTALDVKITIEDNDH